LQISPLECRSNTARHSDLKGICMFNLECQERAGKVIGACVDRFLFGACCHLEDSERVAFLKQFAAVRKGHQAPDEVIPVRDGPQSKAGNEHVVELASEESPPPFRVRFPTRPSIGHGLNSSHIVSYVFESKDRNCKKLVFAIILIR